MEDQATPTWWQEFRRRFPTRQDVWFLVCYQVLFLSWLFSPWSLDDRIQTFLRLPSTEPGPFWLLQQDFVRAIGIGMLLMASHFIAILFPKAELSGKVPASLWCVFGPDLVIAALIFLGFKDLANAGSATNWWAKAAADSSGPARTLGALGWRDKMAFGTSARFRQPTLVTRKQRRTDAGRHGRDSGNQ